MIRCISIFFSVQLGIHVLYKHLNVHVFQVTFGQRKAISATDAKQMDLLYKSQCSGGGGGGGGGVGGGGPGGTYSDA